MNGSNSKNKTFRNFLATPIVHFVVLSTFGVITWQVQGDISMLISFLYIAIFTSVGMAFLLKDNRAFCKCLCPATVFLKVSSAFSLLKIKGETELCNECGMCEETCPMDIEITNYIKTKQRVLSTECVLCMKCINACPTGALRVSVGLDFCGR